MKAFDQLLQVRGGRSIRVQVRGEGPPLLWCHGVFFPIEVDDESTLGRVLRSIDDFTVVRLDARGHGGTPAGSDGRAHRWDEMAEDVIDVADKLGFERFFLGGISMGAAVALHAALQAPHRIQAMLLFALPTAWDTRPAEQARYRDLLALGSSEAVADFARRDLDALFAGNPMPPALTAMVRVLRDSSWDALSRVIQGAAESDMPAREALSRLRVPLLARPWPNDSGHPLSTAEELTRTMPAAELQMLDSFDDAEGMRGAFAALLRKAS
jgi:3-oxoadipate enol-lactonase